MLTQCEAQRAHVIQAFHAARQAHALTISTRMAYEGPSEARALNMACAQALGAVL